RCGTQCDHARSALHDSTREGAFVSDVEPAARKYASSGGSGGFGCNLRALNRGPGRWLWTAPGSKRPYTLADLQNDVAPPDWNPDGHPRCPPLSRAPK